jgi:hypothetical protein
MRLNENITVNGNLSQIDNSPLYMINDLIFTSAGELEVNAPALNKPATETDE